MHVAGLFLSPAVFTCYISSIYFEAVVGSSLILAVTENSVPWI